MGIKRIAIAVLVVASVLGLIILLLFQSGVDEKVIASLLPKVERRYGVTVTFESVDASVTSLSLQGVKIVDKSTGCRLASAKDVKINVRIGPLFFGDIDLTGIRVEAFDIRFGQPAGGCAPEVWGTILKQVGQRTAPDPTSASADISSSKPEIQLSDGRIQANDGHLSFSAEGIDGRLGAENRTVLDIGTFKLGNEKTRLMGGEAASLKFAPDTHRLVFESTGTIFEVNIAKERLLALVRDADESINTLKTVVSDQLDEPLVKNGKTKKRPEDRPSVGIRIKNAVCTLVNPEVPDKRVIIKDIAVESTISALDDVTFNADGSLPGTDAKFRLFVRTDPTTGPHIALKVPDIALSNVGNALYPSSHIDWTNASMDGELQITLPAKNKPDVELSGQTVFTNLTIFHDRLAEIPLRNLDIGADFKLRYDPESQMLHLERLQISRKLARFTIRGDINFSRLDLDLFLNIPPTPCKHVRDALPEALIPRLKSAGFEGKFSADLHLDIDVDTPEEVVFEPSISNQCRFTDFGDIPDPDYYRGPFTYVAYTAEKEPIRLVSGPGTDRWTPYRDLSPYLIETVLTTEDGKFWHHAGITAPEIRRAIELNLKKHTLSHGASTITMQLAKNLLLDRSRTAARKLQEIILVWYLESYFSKEELLELYFNIVEFGPSIYGIRDAAMHYFGRDPSDLNLIESVYLVKLLPNPPARHKSYERGRISEKQYGMLRRVMKTMRERKRLTDSELNEGLREEVVFHEEGDPLPVPRHRTEHLLHNMKLSPIETDTVAGNVNDDGVGF